jgi:hypothetical protein
MTLDEARRISLDRASKHATTTFYLAEHILRDAGEPAMSQLCAMKACVRNGTYAIEDIGN